MSSSTAVQPTDGSKRSLGHLVQWLQAAPEITTDERPLQGWLENRPWLRHGFDLAFILTISWLIARTGPTKSMVLGVPMILAGSIVASRLLTTLPSLELLNSLPLRPQDIVRGQLLVALKKAISSLAPLSVALWIVHAPYFGGGGHDLQIRDIVLAVLAYFLAIVFTLALGLSTDPKHGGLSPHRRRALLCQGLLLLTGHWTLETLPTNAEITGRLTSPLLSLCFIVALAVVCLATLRTQWHAGLATFDLPIWPDWERHLHIFLLPIFILSYVFLSINDIPKAMVYAMLLLHLAQNHQKHSKSWVPRALRWLDVLSFFGLLAVDIAHWMQALTIVHTLSIQLLIVVVWFALQGFGGRPGDRPPAQEAAQETPFVAGAMPRRYPDHAASARRGGKLAIPTNRTSHIARSAWRFFFRFPVMTGRSTSLLFLVALSGLSIAPLLAWYGDSGSIALVAALVIFGVIDRIRRTLHWHPLVSILPVTRRELGQNLLMATASIMVPALLVLSTLILFSEGGGTSLQGTTLGLVLLSHGILMAAVWIFAVAISLPAPDTSRGLSTTWKVLTIFQFMLTHTCLLMAHHTQLSLLHQAAIHSVLWGTLLFTAWFAWRHQKKSLAENVGVPPRYPVGPALVKDPSVGSQWFSLAFVISLMFVPKDTMGGFGALIAFLALITLVLYLSQTIRKASAESGLMRGSLFFSLLGAWLVFRSVVWPEESELDRLHGNLILLTIWTFSAAGWEARRLSRAEIKEQPS